MPFNLQETMDPTPVGELAASTPLARRIRTAVRHSDVWLNPATILMIAFLLAIPLQRAGGDLWIADRIFDWEGGRWSLRDEWWLSGILHDAGRRFSIACWLAVVSAWALSGRCKVPRDWRGPLGYLAVAVLAATLLVTIIKRGSGVDCPWDLLRYGGTRPYLAPFSFETLAAPGACFPGGHASAGYAWLAAGFALSGNPRLARSAFALAITAGLAFGIAQQFRGAHFLSHDLWTLALCWATACALYRQWKNRGHLRHPGTMRGTAA